MFRKFSTFGKITNSKRMRRELAFHKYFQEEKSEVTRKCLTKSLLYNRLKYAHILVTEKPIVTVL